MLFYFELFICEPKVTSNSADRLRSTTANRKFHKRQMASQRNDALPILKVFYKFRLTAALEMGLSGECCVQTLALLFEAASFLMIVCP